MKHGRAEDLKRMLIKPIKIHCYGFFPITYEYIKYLEEKTGHKFIFLKSKKYDGLIDLARKKKRFPSSQRRFCTSELKSIPMIDYILDNVKDDFIVVQGIRAAESENRAKMESQCNYFKYYLQPQRNFIKVIIL